MVAAETGNSGLAMTIALLNAGCSVTAVDKVGMTPLHHACYVGALNVVRYLLERVAPANATGANNTTHSSGATAGFGSNLRVTNGSDNFSGSPTIYCSGSPHGPCRVVVPELLDSQVSTLRLHTLLLYHTCTFSPLVSLLQLILFILLVTSYCNLF